MKNTFEIPTLLIIVLSNDEIISTSGEQSEAGEFSELFGAIV